MKIVNASYSSESFLPDDLFVCAVGYETRSFHLLSKAIKNIAPDNILAFTFPDLINAREDSDTLKELYSGYEKIGLKSSFSLLTSYRTLRILRIVS